MATVFVHPDKLASAHKYGNAIRNKAKREYFWAYLHWLRNGAEGLEPERHNLSVMGAQAVRMHLHGLKLWEGTV